MITPSTPARLLAAATIAVTAGVAAPLPVQAGTVRSGVTAVAAPEIPDTPAGRQLRWVLEAVSRAPLPEPELRAHVSAAFLENVPPAYLNQVFAEFTGITFERLTLSEERRLVARALLGRAPIDLALDVDDAGLIAALVFRSPDARSWSEVDQRLRAVAPHTSHLVAELTSAGECRPVRAHAAGKRRPLGSMIKLYVLGTVHQQIESGAYRWDTELTIKDELKSLPGGELHDRPDGSKVTVLDAAKLMISISDNTATDLLIHQAGREAVERTMRAWGVRDKRNVPLLTTRDMFVLKGVRYPHLAKTYLSLNDRAQRAYLKKVVAGQKPADFKLYTEPRELDTLEWFATPRDICRAYAELLKLDDGHIGQIMSINDGGLGLDRRKWPTVWFKGGSEPGLSDVSYLARTAGGKTYVMTAMAVDHASALGGPATLEQVALARSAFTLAGGS